MPTTFAVPDGRVAMAATTYTGNGSTQTINNAVNGISFTPDMVWNKGRSVAYNHNLVDVIRGNSNVIFSNTTDAEQNPGAQLDITTNGFISTYRSANLANNQRAATYVGWQWKAGGTAVSNTAGTITSSVSANTTAGFSVVKYTTSTTNSTVGHGLGVAPSLVIVRYIGTISNWFVYHASVGAGSYVMLNSTNAQAALATLWNSTSPTSTVFSVGTAWTAAVDTIAYCWAPVAGYSAFGSYTGNGSADGPFIYTGFRPRFVMIKGSSVAGGWSITDTSRDTYNLTVNKIEANTALSEASNAGLYQFDILSNGFKIRQGTGYGINNAADYIYAAFAENPLKYANAR